MDFSGNSILLFNIFLRLHRYDKYNLKFRLGHGIRVFRGGSDHNLVSFGGTHRGFPVLLLLQVA